MKVSKVVMIVVALHVLVIGGIFIFEGCSRAKTPAVETASTTPTPADETAANATALPADPNAQAQPLTPTPAPATTLTPPQPVAPAAPIAPVAKSYVVKKGDTLAKVAKTQGISQAELSKANHLTKTSILRIGQKLTIPGKAEAAPTAVAAAPAAAGIATAADATTAGGTQYAVKSGDSLWKIAKAHNVSVTALKQANNLTSDALKINQKLTIPAGAAASAPVATAAATAEFQPGGRIENGQQVHTVDIGESPSAIAKRYNVTVDQLLKANNISGTQRITVGQKLVIPTAGAQAASSTTPAPTPAVAAPIVSSAN